MAITTTPFENAEEAWFWFIQAYQARNDGAQITANHGRVVRPCDPDDILKILDRLYRHRRLTMHHFRVLRHYGVRMIAPDSTRAREHLAARLWGEAMQIMGEVLIAKGIMRSSLSAEVIWFQAAKEQRMEAGQW